MKGDFIIPKLNKTKLEMVKESINSPTTIDTNIKPKKVHYKEEEKRKYYCSCCGKPYTKQDGNFSKSSSPLYAGNNGYVNICKNCSSKYFNTLTDFFSGNEEKAIDRFCQIFDWYYNDEAVAASRKITAKRTRINVYPSKMNLPQYSKHGDTYLDTIKDRVSNKINSLDELEEERENGNTNVSDSVAKHWGVGLFSTEEYKNLEDHYKMLKKQNPNCSGNQEMFIKDLCYANLLKLEAIKDRKTDDIAKFTQSYQDTFKKAGLKTIQETDSSGEETLGVTLATISQYTPEEYYKDKTLYRDFDGIGDYFKRFILRPLKNLMTGSTDRDEEYCVKDGDDDD